MSNKGDSLFAKAIFIKNHREDILINYDNNINYARLTKIILEQSIKYRYSGLDKIKFIKECKNKIVNEFSTNKIKNTSSFLWPIGLIFYDDPKLIISLVKAISNKFSKNVYDNINAVAVSLAISYTVNNPSLIDIYNFVIDFLETYEDQYSNELIVKICDCIKQGYNKAITYFPPDIVFSRQNLFGKNCYEQLAAVIYILTRHLIMRPENTFSALVESANIFINSPSITLLVGAFCGLLNKNGLLNFNCDNFDLEGEINQVAQLAYLAMDKTLRITNVPLTSRKIERNDSYRQLTNDELTRIVLKKLIKFENLSISKINKQKEKNKKNDIIPLKYFWGLKYEF